MSVLSKIWRGTAHFWQPFWFGFAILLAVTTAFGVYVGKNIQAGYMSFDEFYHLSGYFQIGVLVFCGLWLLTVVRGMHKATLPWSAWLGAVFIIYIIGTSTYNFTLYALHAGDSPASIQGDFADDEGV